MRFDFCTLCDHTYPEHLVTEGVCYQCHEAHDSRVMVLDAPDDDAARELSAHYDDTRIDLAEYAPGDHTAIAEVDVYAYETGCEARGEL